MNEILLDEMYEVEKIVAGPNAKGEYLIKWEGYPDDQNTWEPVEHLPEDMVQEYLDRRPKSKRKRKPGVEIAAVVDESSSTGKEPDNPPRIPKGLGRACVVAVVGKCLLPQGPLRAVDPNTYLKKV